MSLHQNHDIEAEGLLGLRAEEEVRELPKRIPQSRHTTTSCVIQLIVVVCLSIVVFLLGRYSAGPAKRQRDTEDLIDYHLVKFDKGYGQNTTNGRRIVYGGRANEEIDAAWADLDFGTYIRLTPEEARQLDEPTGAVHHGGGYIVSLDVYHQLHCLNYLRMALQPDSYKFKQPPDAFEKHIAHCVNDLRQALQCSADITPMTYSMVMLDGRIAYDPHFEVRRTCRNWDKINDWARQRSLLNDPEIDLLIV
ncbi:hypothetical protein QBC34DRAFT_379166 [Podospora aff. communis PSN243]|uniref:Tat pathway signal sequence n=1 Tax=Podospora aff. communis PSN243 TaxID=3040156 RepID=A0AAV9GQC9_9PEZI|nr:hypothetical protein QBC34DRAFT_379166 [Podospora aff. communis PSN243]